MKYPASCCPSEQARNILQAVPSPIERRDSGPCKSFDHSGIMALSAPPILDDRARPGVAMILTLAVDVIHQAI